MHSPSAAANCSLYSPVATVSLHTLPLKSGTITWAAQSESPYPCLQWWAGDGFTNQTKQFRSFPEITREFQERERLFVVGFLIREDIHLVVLAFILYSSWKSLMGKWSQVGVRSVKRKRLLWRHCLHPWILPSLRQDQHWPMHCMN